ncbi:AdoMet-dependent rRNA methyltransferase spb1 [Microbotryomycetes sp. JL221]|nr:AdoMet-dependent rRNA methyltransferase spb1 [Microbotryomycetes sp. JL221]
MAKKAQKKTAKGRLDKWYQLAKEQGYRARSAYKLVQINKRYDFLASAKCVIDLCAAPGGWLQVAAKNMSSNSLIIGVDLAPIKPIPRCVTLQEDITTESCRRSLRAEMKDWKADVVLHDGAPNVGAAWVQDAFTQVELVLASLKLATEFLRQGGTFCTKVFRSKDYNSLMWVFNQLFTKVEATKPPSSRNVSAEIFVVCQGYLAPAKIDPKLLNAKHVFSDIDVVGSNQAAADAALLEKDDEDATAEPSTSKKLTPTTINVFQPDKKRRNRDGYDEGDYTLHKECNVSQFIKSADPIGVLGRFGQMKWATDEDKKLAKHPLTTNEIKACVDDLKVLGKKDFKNLLKWRLAIREDLGLDNKVKETEEFTEHVEVEPLDEEEQIGQELERLTKEEETRKRRERRKANEKKAREVQKMQLNMVTPMDVGLERQDGIDDGDMFDLGEVEGTTYRKGVDGGAGALGQEDEGSDDEDEQPKSKNARRRMELVHQLENDVDEEHDYDSDMDDAAKRAVQLEKSLDAAYEFYQQEKMDRDAKHKVKEKRRKRLAEEGGEWGGINENKAGSDDEEDDVDSDPAPAPSDDDDSDSDSDSEIDLPEAPSVVKKVKSSTKRVAEEPVSSNEVKLLTKFRKDPKADDSVKSRAAIMWFDQPVFKGMPGMDKLMNGGLSSDEEGDSDDEDEDDQDLSNDSAGDGSDGDAHMEIDEQEESDDDFDGAFETHHDDSDMEEEADFAAQEEAERLKQQRIDDLGLTTAEAMTLAQQLVNRERTKTELINEGFNRHSFNIGGDELPSWFVDDERKHFRNNVPVTKEAVAAIREKMRALNARPIKKVAEAKARKKMRTIRRAEKMRQKAQGINDNDDSGLTEKEKAQSIAKVLSKAKAASAKQPKKETKLVVARGANRGIKGRPKGVKGRYKIVDPIMKKQNRAERRIAKSKKKNGGRRK